MSAGGQLKKKAARARDINEHAIPKGPKKESSKLEKAKEFLRQLRKANK